MAARDVIDYLELMRSSGRLLPGAKVLDFGCGKGQLVTELRTLGWDAHGVDIAAHWAPELDSVCLKIAPPYRIPFEPDAFDLVVSTSVMEHVLDKPAAFREIHRILRPGGYGVHVFPSKYFLPVEPHVKAPFVSWFNGPAPTAFLSICAILGFRNTFQEGLSWRQVVAVNGRYVNSGLNYWSRSKYVQETQRIYADVAFDSAIASCGLGGVARVDRALRCRYLRAVWRELATLFRHQLLLCRK